MSRLAANYPGAVLLSVPDRHHVLYLDRRQKDPGFRTLAAIGRRSPLHATASGKALLAYATASEQEAVLSGPLPASTTTTIVDRHSLAREIRRVREQGFAMCWGEHEPTLSSVAVPAIGPAGRPFASFAVVTSTERLRKSSPSRAVDQLRRAADELSRAVAGDRAFATR
jgi:DNA-binding IclR family transcriptional regulator